MKSRQILCRLFSLVFVVVVMREGLSMYERHVGAKTVVAVLCKDRLSDIPLVLFVQAFTMFDGRQGPFVHV